MRKFCSNFQEDTTRETFSGSQKEPQYNTTHINLTLVTWVLKPDVWLMKMKISSTSKNIFPRAISEQGGGGGWVGPPSCCTKILAGLKKRLKNLVLHIFLKNWPKLHQKFTFPVALLVLGGDSSPFPAWTPAGRWGTLGKRPHTQNMDKFDRDKDGLNTPELTHSTNKYPPWRGCTVLGQMTHLRPVPSPPQKAPSAWPGGHQALQGGGHRRLLQLLQRKGGRGRAGRPPEARRHSG